MVKKVLLIQAPSPVPKGYKFIPFSISYIAAVLENSGCKVIIHDMDVLNQPIDSIVKDFPFMDFDVVGISAHTVSFPNSLRLAELVKGANPRAITVLGGPHVTFMANETLLSSKHVDFVVIGEGEYTLLELILNLRVPQRWGDIKGIAYRDCNQIKITKVRESLDINKIPFPARHLLPLNKYSAPAIITSRGCPHNCIFCSARLSKYRIRSIENVLAEIKLMLQIEPNFSEKRGLVFLDSTFSSSNIVFNLCRGLMSLNLHWTAEVRIDTATEEMLYAMKQAGCVYILFGVESGSNNILNSVNKDITVEKVRNKVKLALDLGLSVTCTFSIGHPNDTEETIEETIQLIKELKSYGASISTSIVTPYPGTQLWVDREK